MMKKNLNIDYGKKVLLTESNAIKKLASKLDKSFDLSVKSILNLKGKLIVSGVGKSGHIAAKISASFTSTGIQSIYLNPVDASHGDLGIIDKNDLILILSNSGESHELNDLLDYAKKRSIKIISITSNRNSLLSKNSDINLLLPPHKEADKLSLIPTTSTTLALSLGDAIICSVLNLRKFDKKSFKEFHPGGNLGRRLTTISEIMDNDLPILNSNASIFDAVLTMTEKKYGCAIVLNKKNLITGIITDGDLRRSMGSLDLNQKATSIMNSKPITVKGDMLISSAIALMNKNSITSLIIAKNNNPIGIVNLKKCIENE